MKAYARESSHVKFDMFGDCMLIIQDEGQMNKIKNCAMLPVLPRISIRDSHNLYFEIKAGQP